MVVGRNSPEKYKSLGSSKSSKAGRGIRVVRPGCRGGLLWAPGGSGGPGREIGSRGFGDALDPGLHPPRVVLRAFPGAPPLVQSRSAIP